MDAAVAQKPFRLVDDLRAEHNAASEIWNEAVQNGTEDSEPARQAFRLAAFIERISRLEMTVAELNNQLAASYDNAITTPHPVLTAIAAELLVDPETDDDEAYDNGVRDAYDAAKGMLWPLPTRPSPRFPDRRDAGTLKKLRKSTRRYATSSGPCSTPEHPGLLAVKKGISVCRVGGCARTFHSFIFHFSHQELHEQDRTDHRATAFSQPRLRQRRRRQL